MAVQPLSDQEITELRALLGHFAGSLVVQQPSSQATQQQAALAWLRVNGISPDPTGASVAAAFVAQFPGWLVSSPTAIPLGNGLFRIIFGAVMSPQAQAAQAAVAQAQAPPTPAPAVATVGQNPPPGVDPAVLASTPVGGTQVGSDGRTYVKRQDQEMMGPGAPYWLPQ